jgi:hypothetical protein
MGGWKRDIKAIFLEAKSHLLLSSSGHLNYFRPLWVFCACQDRPDYVEKLTISNPSGLMPQKSYFSLLMPAEWECWGWNMACLFHLYLQAERASIFCGIEVWTQDPVLTRHVLQPHPCLFCFSYFSIASHGHAQASLKWNLPIYASHIAGMSVVYQHTGLFFEIVSC